MNPGWHVVAAMLVGFSALAVGSKPEIGTTVVPEAASIAAAQADQGNPKTTARTGSAVTTPSAREIRGRVLGEKGIPINQAVVRIVADSSLGESGTRSAATAGHPPAKVSLAETQEDGSFRIRDLSGWSFSVRVEAKGYAPFTQPRVPTGTTLMVDLKRGFTLSGIVRDLDTRKPLAGATVLAWDSSAERFGEAAFARVTTGNDGRFVLADLPRGSVEIQARAPGHAAAKATTVEVPQPLSGAEIPGAGVEFLLKAVGRIAGLVLGSDGKPIEGANVRVRVLGVAATDATRSVSVAPARTTAAGVFSFEELAPGRYQLTAEKKGCTSVERGPFEVQPGSDRANLELRLDTGATLTVRLLSIDGEPIHDLAVELLAPATKSDPRESSAVLPVDRDQISEGEDGRYTIIHLKPGLFTVYFDAGDQGGVEKSSVKLERGKIAALGTLVVHEGRIISGRVIDSAGIGVRGAEVAAHWHDAAGTVKSRRARTRADGRYRLAGLADSAVELVRVRAKGFATAEREGVTPGDSAVDFTLERPGSVAGRVESSSGQAPVAFRIRVYRGDREAEEAAFPAMEEQDRTAAFTDGTGTFRLDELDPGSYTIEAIADGYEPATKSGVLVSSDQVSDAGTLTLKSANLLRGRVLDARDDAPVAGAVVRVEGQQVQPSESGSRPARPGSAVSAEDGSFAIEGLRNGVFNVTVDHPLFSVSRGRIEIQPDQDPPEYIVRLVRGGTLSGTVFGAERQPVVGAAIRIMPVQGTAEDSRTVVTGPDGRYTADRLSPGTYRVTRQPDTGSQTVGVSAKSAVIREGETTTLDFDDAPRIMLSGRVLKGDEPLGGVKLFFSVVGAMQGDSKSTDAAPDGAFTIGLDRGGTYQVSVVGVNAAVIPSGSSTVKLIVPDQPEVQQDIVLLVNTISGRVTGADGRAIIGVVHAVRSGSGAADPARTASAQTNEDGTYRIEGIDPGTYRVKAFAERYRPAENYPVIVSDETPAPVVDFTLEPGRILRGRVVDPQARAIPDALIVVAPTGQTQSDFFPSHTDGSGAFKMAAPADGTLDITAIPPGWAPARLVDVMPPDEEDESAVILQASSGGRLLIRIVSRDGAPAAGAQPLLSPAAAFLGSNFLADRIRPQPTDADGASLVGLLSPGDYVVRVSGLQGVAPVRVAVEDGVESTVLITLP